jgi:pyruvate-ferredoxin/flavodoxin oxidoreductase
VNLNPELFAYDATGKARIRDPDAGPFADLVKAAERCPGRAIHPGTPRNPDDPALAPWIARARKFA